MKRVHYAWVVMAACSAVIFTGIGIFNNTAGVFYRPVAETLGVGIGAVSFRQTIRSLASMLAMPFVARIFARFGMKRVMAFFMIINCGCYFIMSSINALWQFYLISVLMGICGPFLTNIPVPLIINNWFKKRTGMVLGIVLSFTGVGGAVMSPIANRLITSYSWRTAYMVLGAVGFLVAVPAIIFALRITPEEMGLRPYGVSEDTPPPPPPKPIGGVRTRDFLHDPLFLVVVGYSLCITLMSSIVSHMPGVAGELGFDTATGALTASVVMLGLIAGKLVIGSLSDRLGIKTSIFAATVAGSAGGLILIFGNGSYAMLMVGAALIGVTAALPSIATPLIVTKVFGLERYTSVLSYVSLCTSLTGALSVSLYGFLYDFTGTYRIPLVIIVASLGLSFVALSAVMRRADSQPTQAE